MLNDIVDAEVDVQRARLKCDNLKWAAARIDPDKWGDRLNLDINQTVDIGGALADAMKRSRLICDPQNEIEVESTVIKQVSDNSATDCESVDSTPDILK